MNIHLFKIILYICTVRIRDGIKEQAVINATIKVVNEIGFASASISKIAREAGISVGTIYIYHKNKEDLIVSVYYVVKQKITDLLYRDFNEGKSVKENLKSLWDNTLKASDEIPNLLSYSEQFVNSPFYDLLDETQLYELAKPLIELQNQGIKEKVLKPLSFEEFIAFFIAPANFLSNRKMCVNFKMNQENREQTFELAWGTIKK